MGAIRFLIDFILHIDVHLQALVLQYWGWVYGILFAIIFVETGLVIMPFLPGDSLLFVAGSLSGAWYLNIFYILPLVWVAAILGDAVNYHIGKYFGHHMLKRKLFGKHLIKPAHMEKTKHFFDKHGKKTIILARFVPIVRTLAPFVAGIWDMKYGVFFSYNVIWGTLWVVSITLVGYFFGQIELVKNNFEKVVFGIIFISILPILFEYAKHLWESRKTK